MKKNQKYDQSYHSVKSKVLYAWLKKTFSKLSLDNTKQILYDLESLMDNEDVESNQEKRNNASDDSGSDNELESGDKILKSQQRDQVHWICLKKAQKVVWTQMWN